MQPKTEAAIDLIVSAAGISSSGDKNHEFNVIAGWGIVADSSGGSIYRPDDAYRRVPINSIISDLQYGDLVLWISVKGTQIVVAKLASELIQLAQEIFLEEIAAGEQEYREMLIAMQRNATIFKETEVLSSDIEDEGGRPSGEDKDPNTVTAITVYLPAPVITQDGFVTDTTTRDISGGVDGSPTEGGSNSGVVDSGGSVSGGVTGSEGAGPGLSGGGGGE